LLNSVLVQHSFRPILRKYESATKQTLYKEDKVRGKCHVDAKALPGGTSTNEGSGTN